MTVNTLHSFRPRRQHQLQLIIAGTFLGIRLVARVSRPRPSRIHGKCPLEVHMPQNLYAERVIRTPMHARDYALLHFAAFREGGSGLWGGRGW